MPLVLQLILAAPAPGTIHPKADLRILTQLNWRLTGTACQLCSSQDGPAKTKEEGHHPDLGVTGGLKAQAWHRWTVGFPAAHGGPGLEAGQL